MIESLEYRLITGILRLKGLKWKVHGDPIGRDVYCDWCSKVARAYYIDTLGGGLSTDQRFLCVVCGLKVAAKL